MSKQSLEWEVQKYGVLINIRELIHGPHILTMKLYQYGQQEYVEVWENGYKILFKELMLM